MDLLKNKHILELKKILEKVGEKVEGNLVCDVRPNNFVINKFLPKIHNLRILCRGKKKICEIGVNACHSLLIMLMENPDAEYLLFDLNYHKYTKPCLDYIKKQFPNSKINVVFGDSTKTMAEYVKKNQAELNTYDLIHLDGGHTKPVFSSDFFNAKELIVKGGVVIFDDYNFGRIKVYIDEKIKNKQIKKHEQKLLKKTNLHFIYQYC